VPPDLELPVGQRHAPLGRFADRGVSVIIPAWEDCARLRRAIWSVQQTADMPFELIVSCAQRCVAANRNSGLDRATQDLVAFLDDDVLLPSCWMSRLAAVLAAHEDVGAASGHLVFPDGSPQSRREHLADGELWDIATPGTCFLYTRERVDDQRFDEGYRGTQWEDTDWIWRVRARGLRTVVVGGVRVVHDYELRERQSLHENMQRFEATWGRLPTEAESHAIPLADWRAWIAPPLP
jgi:glycosyltransferase involved in cell wall biosynthesis